MVRMAKKSIIFVVFAFMICCIGIICILLLKRNNNYSNNTKNDAVEQEKNINANEIAVLNYHFFYDSSIGEECNETICIEKKEFEKQLLYIKDNGYKTLTIKEFKEWMYGEIKLPKKSVLITIDDGAKGTATNDGNILIPLLEKNNMHAVLFLVTSIRDTKYYQSKNLDLESHGNNIHENGKCGKAKIECYSEEELYNDIKTSIERVNDNTAFCFPFYISNKKAEKVLKKLNVKLAFIGGNKKAKITDDKYKIPRYEMYNYITMDEFKKMIEV